MSVWERFVEDYERVRKDLLRQVELMEAGELFTGEKSEPGRWIDTTSQSLEDAKEKLAEIERLLIEAKTRLASKR